jgi:hypothetical protein
VPGVEAAMNEAKPRQRSLLEKNLDEDLPKEIAEKAVDLLVQLIAAVIPTLGRGKNGEQDHE